jgi:exodeoxyribonuclease-3
MLGDSAMRVITLNLNGIRAAARKGFFTWMLKEQPDIVCLQEHKSHFHQLTDTVFAPKGYERYFYDAQKKGYSGVAMYTRVKPAKVAMGLGWSVADDEARYIQADFRHLSVISLYMPSGTMGEHRQSVKYDFMERFMDRLIDMKQSKRAYIVCGDYNIAHKKIDLKNWRANQKHTGFLPKERAWMDALFDTVGFVDAFRVLNQEEGQYTWWSNFGRAWDNNTGWRLDYQIVTPDLKQHIKKVDIYKKERFSDHSPVIIDYSIKLS